MRTLLQDKELILHFYKDRVRDRVGFGNSRRFEKENSKNMNQQSAAIDITFHI